MFFEPCSHPLYRQGDSWAEEIGLSRKVWTKAFSIVGTHYKTKSGLNYRSGANANYEGSFV